MGNTSTLDCSTIGCGGRGRSLRQVKDIPGEQGQDGNHCRRGQYHRGADGTPDCTFHLFIPHRSPAAFRKSAR